MVACLRSRVAQYTGQHYDPLIGPPPAHTRAFPPAAKAPKAAAAREAAALRIAEHHNEAKSRAAAERSLPAGSLPASPVGPPAQAKRTPGAAGAPSYAHALRP